MNVYNQPAGYSTVHPSQAVPQPYPADPSYIHPQHVPGFPQAPANQQVQLPAAQMPEQLTQQPQPVQQPQHQPVQQPVQQAAQPQPAAQATPPVIEDGPPYDYIPNGQYADTGAQAWAQ
jgi:hypothetical protein